MSKGSLLFFRQIRWILQHMRRNFLSVLRRRALLTQRQLEQISGFGERSFQRWEQDSFNLQRLPNFTISRLADVLGPRLGIAPSEVRKQLLGEEPIPGCIAPQREDAGQQDGRPYLRPATNGKEMKANADHG